SDDLLVVVRVNDGEATRFRQLLRVCARIVEELTVENHLGAVTTRVHHLDAGRVARHHDHRRYTESTSVVGHALRVVAGRGRDDTACTLLGAQRQKFVERAALLETGGELVILELQVDLRAGDPGKRLRKEAGRPDDVAV